MIDPDVQNSILTFIAEEASRIKYGKLYIELSVVSSDVVDAECTPKKRIQFGVRKTK